MRTFSEDLKNPVIESELQQQMQRAKSMDVYSYLSLRLVRKKMAVVSYLFETFARQRSKDNGTGDIIKF